MELHQRFGVTHKILTQRKRDFYQHVCGKFPPDDYVEKPENSDKLQQWVIDNLIEKFSYATGISIMDAADNIALSQLDNGYEMLIQEEKRKQ